MKGAADVLALRHRERRAQQDRRHHARLDRLAVDLAPNQLGEDERALRVSDEHDAAPSVLVFDVVIPGISDIVVVDALLEWRPAAAGQGAAKPGERDLTVERRERTAHGSEPRELLANDV